MREDGMAHDAGIRPVLVPGSLPQPIRGVHTNEPTLDMDRLLEGLWHLLTSMRFAFLLMLGLAALGVIGSLVMQMPPGIADDARAKADWLIQVRPRYGGWTGLLDTLQLFGVFTSIWFRSIVVGLTVSLLVCTVQRVPGILKTANHPHVEVGAAFFEHAPQHERVVTREAPANALEGVRGVLRGRRYRALVTDDGTIHVYADRFRFAPVGGLLGHLSLLVILAGAMVGSTIGFRDPNFMIAEGATAVVASGDSLSVKLEAFRSTYYTDTGAPSDYSSDLVLYQGTAVVARQTVRVNEPLRYGDLSFYQAFYGQTAVMRVTDANGADVYAGGVPLAWTTDDGSRRIGTFTLPGQNLVAWVVGTAGPTDPDVKPGQMRVELYGAGGNGAQVAAQTLDQGKPVEIDGLHFAFQRESQFTGLIVARDPGAPLVWLGASMLVIGFAIRFLIPHRRVWARIVAGPRRGAIVSVAAMGRHDFGLDTEFTNLVTDIRAALQTAPQA
jgi:cytochrome c biogenesis protein